MTVRKHHCVGLFIYIYLFIYVGYLFNMRIVRMRSTCFPDLLRDVNGFWKLQSTWNWKNKVEDIVLEHSSLGL